MGRSIKIFVEGQNIKGVCNGEGGLQIKKIANGR
jgi:hypothetical protein